MSDQSKPAVSMPEKAPTAVLVLEDGAVYHGHGIGAVGKAVGEVCFNTSMTGYQEILTDPSYAGQIITFTFPHIGNVGANEEDIETDDRRRTRPRAARADHGAGEFPLDQTAERLAQEPESDRRHGRRHAAAHPADPRSAARPKASSAMLPTGKFDIDALLAEARGLAGPLGHGPRQGGLLHARPTPGTRRAGRLGAGYGKQTSPRHHVVAVDYGIKRNILRCLASNAARVTVVPGNSTAEDILKHKPDGVFLSNGPGDPAATGEYAVPVIKGVLDSGLPIFGICLGHQMLALALGAKTVKMHQGHRGANHPVKDFATGKVEITSMNHGFTVDRRRACRTRVEVTHARLFDGYDLRPPPQGPAGLLRPIPPRGLARPAGQPLPLRALHGDARWTMPKRTDIKSILVIGAGPIIIGQACEFDYSGTQACKALREEGYRIVLVNSNPATIMTDPELADATYVEPITPAMVAKIIEKERPDALLPTMGGQTALNTALALYDDGTLEKFGVTMIGANADAIRKAEDRLLFRDAMTKIGLESPRSGIAYSIDEALKVVEEIGLPAIIRPSFTLGGTGGGIAYNREEFVEIASRGIEASPVNEILIEESVLGWKEFEMEVVRDKADNCIIICSIENVDPMGIHTGDSITVAPALTLTDKEYQIMRNASIAVLREIGVETGGSNVQFAVNPENGRMVVIEMNPRVSRSSALASKATGFPIAKVAAKLAVGYTLDELKNDITEVTPASFEPTIDYVVTKIPRFTFEKFPGAQPLLTTAMKSVGEAMAIGRSFPESLQKALRSHGDRADRPRRGRDPRPRLERTGAGQGAGGPRRADAGSAPGHGPGDARRLLGRGHPRHHQIRAVVPAPDQGDHRRRDGREGERLADDAGRLFRPESAGLLRCAACEADWHEARRDRQSAPLGRDHPGL